MQDQHPKKHGSYRTLLISGVLSFLIMYAVMFLNVADADHIRLSTTRFYMSLLMVLSMQFVMIGLMAKMFPDKKKNAIILGTAGLAFILVLVLLRTQVPVKDIQYMKAMIPHHSSAILTSRNADIRDPEVRKLADKIIKAQEEEIAEMNALIEKLD